MATATVLAVMVHTCICLGHHVTHKLQADVSDLK